MTGKTHKVQNTGEKEGWSRSDIISVSGIFFTILTIVLGIYTTNITIRSSFKQIQKTNMIEQSSELPIKLNDLIRNASCAFAYNANSCDSTISDKERKEFKQQFEVYDKKQSQLLDEIAPLMFSYGSEESIEVFNMFYLPLREKVNDSKRSITTIIKAEEWLPIYYKLPLLASLVKYDTTGEVINSSIFFEVFMPEFERYEEEVKNVTNQIINKQQLSKNFIWK